MRIEFTVWTRLILIACLGFAGCAFERHYSIRPGQNQVIRVESGDRWYFTLPKREEEWEYECDDDDVEVRLTPDEKTGCTKALIRIHRGYDGPSEVSFSCGEEEFVVTMFKRAESGAFWCP